MWLINRKSVKQDKLEADLAAIRAAALLRMESDIAKIAAAGDAREIRILDAINAQALTVSSELQEMRTEVSVERQRIQRELEECHRDIREQARRIDGFDRRYRA